MAGDADRRPWVAPNRSRCPRTVFGSRLTEPADDHSNDACSHRQHRRPAECTQCAEVSTLVTPALFRVAAVVTMIAIAMRLENAMPTRVSAWMCLNALSAW